MLRVIIAIASVIVLTSCSGEYQKISTNVATESECDYSTTIVNQAMMNIVNQNTMNTALFSSMVR